MTRDIFSEVRRMVTPEEAARLYGYQPNRAGFVRCPFHNERTASLKLYKDGWHCFGCGAGGSVIDFVAQLFDLSPLDAVRRLNDDFRLGLSLDRAPTRTERAEIQHRKHTAEVQRDFLSWVDQMQNRLNACHRLGWLALKRSPETWTAREVLAIRWLPVLEDWSDSLSGGIEAQMQLFRVRKEVEALCSQILNSMQQKSSAA